MKEKGGTVFRKEEHCLQKFEQERQDRKKQ